jgi:LysM repeat protein
MTSTAHGTPVRFDAPRHRDISSGVRLTRRGRVVVLLALLALALVAFTLGRVGSSQAATEPSVTTPYSSTTVHAGETLWTVAKRIAPGHDPRDVVEQLRSLNHLAGSTLQSGQQLLLPHAA